MRTLDTFQTLKWGFVLTCFAGVALAFVIFFMQLDTEGTSLGIDLIFSAFEGGDIYYQINNGLRKPPWSVLILVPTGFIPSKAAWGLLVFATLAVLILSVPMVRPKWRYWLSVFIVVTAFPTLRVIADAQLEVLVIGGILLIHTGYKREHPYLLAAGILLATAKPQVVVLVMPVLGLFVLQTWRVENWLKAGAAVLAVVIPTMLWRGADWIAAVQGTYQAGSILDIGLNAALNRLGFVPSPLIFMLWLALLLATLYLVCRSDRTFSREKIAMLMAASMLLSPYTAGNSVLNVFVIGVIPLFHKRVWIGLALILMVNFFYPFNSPQFIRVYAYYWTVFLLVCWVVLNWHLYRSEAHPERNNIQTENVYS